MDLLSISLRSTLGPSSSSSCIPRIPNSHPSPHPNSRSWRPCERKCRPRGQTYSPLRPWAVPRPTGTPGSTLSSQFNPSRPHTSPYPTASTPGSGLTAPSQATISAQNNYPQVNPHPSNGQPQLGRAPPVPSAVLGAALHPACQYPNRHIP